MTAGNRIGIKMYSFNTTIRMPDKNIEFLKLFKKFEGKLFDDTERLSYYIEAIKENVVEPKNVLPSVREKIRSGQDLSNGEIKEILTNNRPKNGFGGRVGDFMSAMASQGFLQKQGKRYRLTSLGDELLLKPENETDIYTKAMIGLQYGSVDRNTAANKAIPFLNTIFVMNELNTKYDQKEVGISDFELGVFVFTMSDCNYKKTASEIMEYRKTNGTKKDYEFAMSFVHNVRKILVISKNTLDDYTDEVLRKFKKTGLFSEDKKYKKNIYKFSEVESEKINLLIKKYENYKWVNYNSIDDYFNNIEQIVLPWEEDDSLYSLILKKKAELIGWQNDLNNLDKTIREEIESKYSEYVFQNMVKDKYTLDLIIQELEIINGKIKGKSILPDTENYIKLEWFTSLLLSNKFGSENVKSNLRYYDDGTPKCCASGNEPDVELHLKDTSYNIEVTTISNKNQQVNMETTTVLRHLDNINKKNNNKTKAIMIAPYIHYDTINIYQISAKGISTGTIAVPLTIDAFIKAVVESSTLEDFDNEINKYAELLLNSNVSEFEKLINEVDLINMK